MQNNLPIGVFDSGLGGLTIVKALKQTLPNESFIYFGDTAHLPYGDKSPELLRGFIQEIALFLLKQPVKALIIACNTATAVARDLCVRLGGDIPVFDVIRPAVELALAQTQNNKVAVIGTKTTVKSGIYSQLIQQKNSQVSIIEKATPLLVPMIEEGWLHNNISQDVIDAYMSDTGFHSIDTLILGCTHYPLIKSQIASYFKTNYEHSINVIDSSKAVANYVKQELKALKLDISFKNLLPHHFYLSDFTTNFEDSAALFLSENVKFQKIDLSQSSPSIQSA